MILRALQLAAGNGDWFFLAFHIFALIGMFALMIVPMVVGHYEIKELKKQRRQQHELRLARIRVRAINFTWGCIHQD